MSVLIKGMEMPKSCYDCSFAVETYEGSGVYACVVTDNRVYKGAERIEDCPLIHVPPHGRLIDEENICGKLRPLIENPYCYNRLQIISETLAHCLRIISDTPTIIPAEEEEICTKDL